ncbi:MAG: hypothetical protein V4495_28735 [Pseudomonadota bacterium]
MFLLAEALEFVPSQFKFGAHHIIDDCLGLRLSGFIVDINNLQVAQLTGKKQNLPEILLK